MATDLVHVRNTDRGTVGTVERKIFESPVFNQGILIEVDADAKPYVPELYKPRDAQTFLAEKSKASSTTETAEPQAPVDTKQKDAD